MRKRSTGCQPSPARRCCRWKEPVLIELVLFFILRLILESENHRTALFQEASSIAMNFNYKSNQSTRCRRWRVGVVFRSIFHFFFGKVTFCLIKLSANIYNWMATSWHRWVCQMVNHVDSVPIDVFQWRRCVGGGQLPHSTHIIDQLVIYEMTPIGMIWNNQRRQADRQLIEKERKHFVWHVW